MPLSRGKLYTYTGSTAFPEGAPTLFDIAVSLCREGRYAGAGLRWWPVGLHTFVVCDLLPPALKIHGLLHDSPECITGDIPRPVKSDAIEETEHELLAAIYKNFGLALPTAAQHAAVKKADMDAFAGEVYTVGTQALQAITERCPKAENLVMKYVAKYSYEDCLNAGGAAPIDFCRRFRIYMDMLKSGMPVSRKKR